MPTLAKVCLSQPVRRQTMRNFFPLVMWCRVELCARSDKVSAPKTKGLTQDRFSGEGGSLTAPRALLHSRNVCLEKILPVPPAGHFAEKAPCRRAEGLSRWVLPEAWVVFGGCVGHAPVKHRPPQNTRKVFNNASSCMRHGQLTAGSLRKL